MQKGTASALTVIRVPRGTPAPKPEECRTAIAEDRARQHLDRSNSFESFSLAGPYAVLVDGQELDEYVVWEH